MNIGIVTTWFERGAAYVSKQFEDVLNEDHKVFIYARGGESYAINDPKWDKKNVYWAKRYNYPLIPTYIDEREFMSWVKQNEIKIILFNEQNWWRILNICKINCIKIGAYIDYYTKYTVQLFRIYDFLICNTKRHHEVFSEHPQAYYIPWGTDTSLYSPRINNVKNHYLKFFHSAGMSPHRKGTDLVIKAFNVLAENYNNIELIVHTQVNLVHHNSSLDKLIEDLISKQRLKIIKKTVPAPGLYYLGDVYVYPSRLEGIGLTIAEALACGLPVITSDCQPMNEFIKFPSSTVPIDKFYYRKDEYYWPMCEIKIDGLIERMKFYIDNIQKLNEYKSSSRNYALNHLNWSKNRHYIKEAFEKSQILNIDDNILALAKKEDNKKDKIFRRFPLSYNVLFKYISNISI